MSYQTLFSSITINKMELENRVLMAPTGGNMASEDSFVSPEMVEFYLRRTEAGSA